MGVREILNEYFYAHFWFWESKTFNFVFCEVIVIVQSQNLGLAQMTFSHKKFYLARTNFFFIKNRNAQNQRLIEKRFLEKEL